MADATAIRWIYPPNWAGVLSEDQRQGFKDMSVMLSCVSDSTGETDAIKVNLSELRGPTGKPALRTVIKKIWYEIFGMIVALEWERDTDIPIATLNAGTGETSGEIDFTNGGKYRGLVDPGGDGTGDIVLTTTNGAAADEYNIRIDFEVKET